MNMKNNLIEKNRANICAAFLLLIWMFEFVINIWFVARYFVKYKLDSDFAGDAVLAKHLADTGNYIFSSDWYPTTEVYVIHHQLIMTPLFKIFKDYSLVWILTSSVAFLLLSLSIYFFMRCLNSSINRAIIAVILFMNPVVTFQMSFSVWFHGYLFYYIMAFVLLGLLFKYRLVQTSVSRRDIILTTVFSFMAGLCGVRMFLVLFVPFAITYCIYIYNKECRSIFDQYFKLILLSFLSAFVGFGIYSFYLAPKYGDGSLVRLGFTLYDSGTIKDNILTLPQVIIDGLCIDFARTSDTYYAAITLVLALLWVIVLSNNLMVIFNKRDDYNYRFIAMFSFICMIVNLAFMVITLHSDEFISRYRYFALSTFAQLPVFVATNKFAKPYKVGDVVKAIVIGLSVLSILIWKVDQDKIYSEYNGSWREGYINYLISNGYSYGSSTYWNADTTIFESNGLLQVSPVYNDENFTFFEWNTQRSYKGKTPEFIILTIEEYDNRVANGWQQMPIIYEDDYVVIFDYES
ncbi:hypothetical protein SAMN04487884_13514 [Butyrivibrio fibrisolvens]|uniref:Glycosyltransferase RgtA/B/C/D-like domain-containing protein n=2 Tax=Butyrivibrio fibrisolvens TaxID=831 RepID=A0A1H9WVH7_BUTFI|nr:hypothetical protein SAMN04487884_13514 [Butyrivibrio fibrisolvens]